MIGYVPKMIAEVVSRAGGPGALERVLAAAALDPESEFRIDRHYDDGETLRLIAAACGELGIDVDTACEAVAAHFMADASARFPAFFAMSPNARALITRQPKIHGCMAAGVSNLPAEDGVRGRFEIGGESEDGADGDLLVTYASPNRLGRLYRALARAALAHYGETASVDALDDIDGETCRFRITWRNRDG